MYFVQKHYQTKCYDHQYKLKDWPGEQWSHRGYIRGKSDIDNAEKLPKHGIQDGYSDLWGVCKKKWGKNTVWK